MALRSEVCFRLARRLVLTRQPGQAGANPASFDPAAYQAWRAADLQKQFAGFLSTADVEGLDVLDFGCGDGDLSLLVAGLGAKSVTGIDLSQSGIRSAEQRAANMPVARRPRFALATSARSIDLPDQSVDLILCFDVLEHVMDYEQIVAEWRRVLRSGGNVAIWWVPWWHPYGPHIESLVPIPWAHVFFSERVLLATCARLYAMPEFRPRVWDLDEDGNKRPNKWHDMTHLPAINRLTMWQFERLCRHVGFAIAERRLTGFGASRLARSTHLALHVPFLREFFTSSVVYRLRKS